MPVYTKLNTLKNKKVISYQFKLLNQEKMLKIAILNLMPLKEDTESQLLKKLSNSEKNIEVTFLKTASYISKNVDINHMNNFYFTYDDIKEEYFDGLIITGAPVEQLEFNKVIYWEELKKIMDWSKTHVKSTLHICWGAQAGLKYHYNINKHLVQNKIFGVFNHNIESKTSKILLGFNEGFKAPHSRYTTIYREDIINNPDLNIVSESNEAGIFIVENINKKQLFVMGHLEYAKDTLDKEYKRDLSKGLEIKIPSNYYENNNPNLSPIFSWKENGDRLYLNWVNYYL